MEKLEKIVKIVTKDKSLSLWIGIWRMIVGGFASILPVEVLHSGDHTSLLSWICFIAFPMIGWTLFSGLLLVINGLSKTPFDSD
nr:hypothetical protein [uncultured Draconibacterium sp.]